MEYDNKSDRTSDRELIISLKKGEIYGYEVLFERYYNHFLYFAKGMLKSEDIAMDIVQNTFMKVWINKDSLDESQSIKNYLFVLCKHEIYNHFRNKKTSITALRGMLEESKSTISRSEIGSKYDTDKLTQTVDTIVESMPDRRKEVYKMSRTHQMTNQEIADSLKISIRTVEKHIELALKEIRGKLGHFTIFLLLILNI